MQRTTRLIAALSIVAVVILIGTALLLRGSAPPPASQRPTATAAEPDGGLARAMTFTEPKK